ncbi:MAG: glycosyl hydrolase, partial [Acidimicrobiia bacterium]
SEAGRPPAIYQQFWNLDVYPFPDSWVGRLSDYEAQGMIPYFEVTTDNLAALNSGQKDTSLNAMAEAIGDWLKAGANRHVLVAPLPEMNLPEHLWSGDPDAFKTGYQRIRQAFLDQGLDGTQVRFVFAPYGKEWNVVAGYYPGDSSVDLVGFARYNKNSPWQDYQSTFQNQIDGAQEHVSWTKPILITQTGSVEGSGGSRAVWFDDMFTNLKAHDQVIGAIYFNKNKDNDYRVLVNGVLDAAFEVGYDKWSDPSEVSWIFDGRMDTWVQDREATIGQHFLDSWGHTFQDDIKWLADEGITAGCNPPTNSQFCPDDLVTRGAMAAFLVRALGYTDDGGGDLFTDDNDSVFESDIDKLGTAGVTRGCNPPTNSQFCPDDYVTRGAMAAFLVRALGYTDDGGGDLFTDDNDSVFESDIDKLGTAGVTAGCNPPTNDQFCPDDYVTRGAMAAFLHRALGT